VYIPTLCASPQLPPTGRCGVCLVHVEGRTPPLVKACKTLVEDGMYITTDTPEGEHQSQANLHEFLGMRSLEQLAPSASSSEIEDLIRHSRTAAAADAGEL
jgi:predicted molibdopterin-dependent oxidoreductase YjgC